MANLDGASTIREIVECIRAIPYGRPSEQTADVVRREWRGTCSTKHLLLKELVPSAELWHRVYRITEEDALARFGEEVAAVVPPGGVVDVHTYALIDGVVVDVTFPGDLWDGVSDMPLACGPGIDVRAGDDPLETKRALVEEHCDPRVRERFIAALSAS